MLKLGEKIISDIYLGDKKIAKVFWGDKLVYQAGKPIFLDYIESTGEQYINTDYIMTSDVQEVECEFQYTDKTDTQQIFGTNAGSSSGIYPSTNSGNIFIRGGSNSYVVNFAMDYTKKHTLYAKAEVGQLFIATFDGKTKQSTNAIAVINTTHPWYLFGLNKGDNSDAIYKYKGRIYLFKMYDNGVLVRDLRPCIDPKGIVCMYDMVTKKYFYNQGTGTFKASGRFVESIVFDGASYIDTGIEEQDCIIKSTVQLQNTGYRQFVGGWSHLGGCYIAVDTSNQFELGANVILTGTNATDVSNIVAEHSSVDMRLTVNGVTKTRATQVQAGVNGTYLLGDMNSIHYTGYIKGKVFNHQFINVEGKLIQDLRPYVDENGVAGFYDMVTGKVFYNQGTGKLEYTE